MGTNLTSARVRQIGGTHIPSGHRLIILHTGRPGRLEWGTATTEDSITIEFSDCLAEGKCKALDTADMAHVVLISSKLGEVNHVCLG